MSDVTKFLSRIESGDSSAAEQLLPLVYDELRRLAAARLANERPGQTLQATALVHEAYLRLVDDKGSSRWEDRRHFFAAAAEAMRRLLIERARRRKSKRHGGDWRRVELADRDLITGATPDQLLVLNEALERFGEEEPEGARLVKLCLFAGLSVERAGKVLGMSRATSYRHWAYARAALIAAVSEDDTSS